MIKTKSFEPSSKKDIHKVCYDILRQSNAFDVFPTPVSKIVQFAELRIDQSTSMHNIPNHYISKKIDVLKRAMSKVFGALDCREKIIYLNPDLHDVKKNFVQMHEVAHHTLPWQKATLQYVEDEKTLDPHTQEVFESEANFFASAALFQMDRFEDISRTLPLEIRSVRYLAKHFGGSVHAAMRRYVETINRKCALIVLSKDEIAKGQLLLRNYFQSPLFTKEFGEIEMPEVFTISWPFVQDFVKNRRVIDYPQPLEISDAEDDNDFEYQYFNNGYNIFILFMPKGEKIMSRKTIVIDI